MAKRKNREATEQELGLITDIQPDARMNDHHDQHSNANKAIVDLYHALDIDVDGNTGDLVLGADFGNNVPETTGHAGKVLATDGTDYGWQYVDSEHIKLSNAPGSPFDLATDPNYQNAQSQADANALFVKYIDQNEDAIVDLAASLGLTLVVDRETGDITIELSGGGAIPDLNDLGDKFDAKDAAGDAPTNYTNAKDMEDAIDTLADSLGGFNPDGSIDINVDGLPPQTGQDGNFLTTDGIDASWAAIDFDTSQLEADVANKFDSGVGPLKYADATALGDAVAALSTGSGYDDTQVKADISANEAAIATNATEIGKKFDKGATTYTDAGAMETDIKQNASDIADKFDKGTTTYNDAGDVQTAIESIEGLPSGGSDGDVLTISGTDATWSDPTSNPALKGDKGDEGDSAYEVWLGSNPGGTEAEYLEAIKGDTGDAGENGKGWTDGAYDAATGVVTFNSNDGLGFFTGDLRGADGADGTGVQILGSYDTEADLISAQPNGNPGDAYLVAGDLYVWDEDNNQWVNVGRIQGPDGDPGADGKGWTGGTYDASTGIVTFTSTDGLGFSTTDLRGGEGAQGKGFTGGTYEDATGVVTFTSDDGLGFATGDLRGAAGAAGADGDSAYQVWLDAGGTGSEQDFLDSLKGEDYDATALEGKFDKGATTYSDAGAMQQAIEGIVVPDVSDFVTGDELTTALSGKADEPHTHDEYLTDLTHDHDGVYAADGHNHDSEYAVKATETEAAANTTKNAEQDGKISALEAGLEALDNKVDTLENLALVTKYKIRIDTSRGDYPGYLQVDDNDFANVDNVYINRADASGQNHKIEDIGDGDILTIASSDNTAVYTVTVNSVDVDESTPYVWLGVQLESGAGNFANEDVVDVKVQKAFDPSSYVTQSTYDEGMAGKVSVGNDVDNDTYACTAIVALTKAEYELLTPDPTTMYLVVG